MITGRYILQPEIFPLLGSQQTGSGGEIQLTDAMIRLMAEQAFAAVRFDGRSYDCGDKIGFLAANVAFALDREDISDKFMVALDEILARARSSRS
jgi:UTP--glucose-1-phosphate uridylyltransferase